MTTALPSFSLTPSGYSALIFPAQRWWRSFFSNGLNTGAAAEAVRSARTGMQMQLRLSRAALDPKRAPSEIDAILVGSFCTRLRAASGGDDEIELALYTQAIRLLTNCNHFTVLFEISDHRVLSTVSPLPVLDAEEADAAVRRLSAVRLIEAQCSRTGLHGRSMLTPSHRSANERAIAR